MPWGWPGGAVAGCLVGPRMGARMEASWGLHGVLMLWWWVAGAQLRGVKPYRLWRAGAWGLPVVLWCRPSSG